MRLGAMRLWRAGAALVVMTLTLVLSACGSVTARATTSAPRAQASATQTPALTTAPTLSWRKVTMPIQDDGHSGIAMNVSPVNGRVAWICAPASGGRYTIWRTQDAGMTWRQMTALTPAAPPQATTCSVVPDQNLATGVVAYFITGNPITPGGPQSALAYYSSDGGASWTEMPRDWWVQEVATSGDVTYALSLDLAHGGGNSVLYASFDHLQTWQPINPTSQPMQQNTQFWAASDSGELLFSLNYTNRLYHSTDNGRHWTQTLAQVGAAISVALASWRGPSAGWLICGSALTGQVTQTQCSQDLGKMWTARKNPQSSCNTLALAADGALYSLCAYQPPTATASQWAMFRLPLGSATWTVIGQTPYNFVTMTQSGQVWCTDGSGLNNTYVLDRLP